MGIAISEKFKSHCFVRNSPFLLHTEKKIYAETKVVEYVFFFMKVITTQFECIKSVWKLPKN